MNDLSLTWTLLFSAALVLGLLLKLYLSSRQIRHVARHRDTVPPAFAATISLASHQKAADYTLTKARFGLLELAFGSAVPGFLGCATTAVASAVAFAAATAAIASANACL
jgi:STE24 endopeptidase